MLEYKKMSLFDAEPGSILVHAVNAQGVWGSGIAKEFKERYPKAFEHYHEWCLIQNQLGNGKVFHSGENHVIGWIVTSEYYGKWIDSKGQILVNTALSLYDLCNRIEYYNNEEVVVYSNKFNSGLFNVPWEETEVVLKEVLKHYPNITWVVCDPNLE